jgi:hypothetical protein
MSVSSLTTIAAARLDAPITKGNVGKVPAAHPKAADKAGIGDLLVKQVPTELVAPYTALSAAIVGAVAKPTPNNVHPDQLASYRWVAFGMLIVFVIAFVWTGTARKANLSPLKVFPALPLLGSLVASIGWAFALPSSPLVPYLHSKTATTLVPLFVAFAATGLLSLTAAGLTSQVKRKSPRQPSRPKNATPTT